MSLLVFGAAARVADTSDLLSVLFYGDWEAVLETDISARPSNLSNNLICRLPKMNPNFNQTNLMPL